MSRELLSSKWDLENNYSQSDINNFIRYFAIDKNINRNDALWLIALHIFSQQTAHMPNCMKQDIARYLLRPSPAYKAEDCKNTIMLGNDNNWYQSKSNIKGIYTWRKIPKPKELSDYLKMSPASLLNIAVQKNCIDLVKEIISQYGKQIDKQDLYNAMLVATSAGFSNIVKYFTTLGLSQNAVIDAELVAESEGDADSMNILLGKKETGKKQKVPVGCQLTRSCPQRYKLQELKDIAKACGIKDLHQTKKDLCVAIRKITKPVEKGSLYDVIAQGVMLANDYLGKKTGKPTVNPSGWLASEKYDGVRALWDGRNFVSRQGVIYNAPNWYIALMPSNIVLDGELYIDRDEFQKTVSVVKKKIPIDKEWERIKYMVFDLPLCKKNAEERITDYTKIVDNICSKFKENKYLKECPIKVVQQIKIKNASDLNKQYKIILSQGGEGMMIRRPESKYVGKRSNDLLKYKPTFDSEAKIIGYEKGTGKNKDKLGAFLVRDLKTGKEFKVGSGITDEQRENYKKTHPLGTIITYLYTSFTKDGIPRHPRYFRIRPKV
jgi:DNA ligase-1